MLDFLDLSKSRLVGEYIKTHTHKIKKNAHEKDESTEIYWNPIANIWLHKNVYSTFRDSKSHAFEWRKHIAPNDILETQEECKEPMAKLGYRQFSKISEDLLNDDYILMEPKSNTMIY